MTAMPAADKNEMTEHEALVAVAMQAMGFSPHYTTCAEFARKALLNATADIKAALARSTETGAERNVLNGPNMLRAMREDELRACHSDAMQEINDARAVVAHLVSWPRRNEEARLVNVVRDAIAALEARLSAATARAERAEARVAEQDRMLADAERVGKIDLFGATIPGTNDVVMKDAQGWAKICLKLNATANAAEQDVARLRRKVENLETMAKMGPPPKPPEYWQDAFSELREKLSVAETRADAAERALAEVKAQIDAVRGALGC